MELLISLAIVSILWLIVARWDKKAKKETYPEAKKMYPEEVDRLLEMED